MHGWELRKSSQEGLGDSLARDQGRARTELSSSDGGAGKVQDWTVSCTHVSQVSLAKTQLFGFG